MDEDFQESRISRISTNWELWKQAHAELNEVGSEDDLREARDTVLRVYERAVRSYLAAMLRQADAVDEVFSEFALRFVAGRYRNVAPARGRFREYLKTVLKHLADDYRKSSARTSVQAKGEVDNLAEVAVAPDTVFCEAAFDEECRWTILDRALERLRNYECSTGRPYHSVLQYRAAHPGESLSVMAEVISRQLGRNYRHDALRQVLSRARREFSEIVLCEVADSLGTQDVDLVEQEVLALRLHPYCVNALAEWRIRHLEYRVMSGPRSLGDLDPPLPEHR
jgi:DNA-directed RNA polymerase specialized sigma24 family protein